MADGPKLHELAARPHVGQGRNGDRALQRVTFLARGGADAPIDDLMPLRSGLSDDWLL
jgi:hypothetical protein